jgi:hypothetical protein
MLHHHQQQQQQLSQHHLMQRNHHIVSLLQTFLITFLIFLLRLSCLVLILFHKANVIVY